MSEFLSVYRKNAEAILQESLPFVLSRKFGYARLLRFCENYRIKGIVHLLLDAEPEDLHASLFASGRAFLAGLAFVATDDIVVSEAAPLFDAIACNDFAGATRIAAALPSSWRSDVEYEDDFLYVDVLCRLFLRGPPGAEAQQQLRRLEERAPPDDPRPALVRSVLNRDAEAFSTALAALLRAYEAHHLLLAERGRVSAEAAGTFPFFCTPGLALVRLAERAGLSLPREYPLIPSITRGDFGASFSEDSWKQPRAR